MPEHFIQLVGPSGAFYVRPDMVCSIGHAHVADYTFPNDPKPVRLVTTVGQSVYFMYDDARNMSLLLDAKVPCVA